MHFILKRYFLEQGYWHELHSYLEFCDSSRQRELYLVRGKVCLLEFKWIFSCWNQSALLCDYYHTLDVYITSQLVISNFHLFKTIPVEYLNYQWILFVNFRGLITANSQNHDTAIRLE